MTGFLETPPLDERDMSPQFREAEEQYRSQASELWTEAEELKRRTRRNVDDEPEERQSAYIQSYSAINARFDNLANEFTKGVEQQRQADKHLLSEGTGPRFADHLVDVSSKPDEELRPLMQTARRTGQRDLTRAIAQVALDRNQFGVFSEWASSEPELANAMKRLRTTPGLDQLRTRTLAMRPPRADAATLEPTEQDHKQVVSKSAAEAAARAAFFNLPYRQVGRRVS